MKLRSGRAALLLALTIAPFFAWAQVDSAQVAPFVTTPFDVVDRMLSIANTGPADTVVDLGSGDGRIVIAAARKFGAKGLGLELDRPLRLPTVVRQPLVRRRTEQRSDAVQVEVRPHLGARDEVGDRQIERTGRRAGQGRRRGWNGGCCNVRHGRRGGCGRRNWMASTC